MTQFKFKDLAVGDTFDFIDDNNRMHTSFYKRCVKVSDNKYRSLADVATYRVGTIKCNVFHVERKE
jgi:hypothetical protein